MSIVILTKAKLIDKARLGDREARIRLITQYAMGALPTDIQSHVPYQGWRHPAQAHHLR